MRLMIGAATLAATLAVLTTATATADTVRYANCDAVRAAGKAPLHKGEPGYRAGLDADGDGVACETDESSGTSSATSTSKTTTSKTTTSRPTETTAGTKTTKATTTVPKPKPDSRHDTTTTTTQKPPTSYTTHLGKPRGYTQLGDDSVPVGAIATGA